MPFPQCTALCILSFFILSCWVVQDQIRFPLIIVSLRRNKPSSVSLSLCTGFQPHNHPGGSLLDLQKESKTPSRKQKSRKSFFRKQNKKPLPLYIGVNRNTSWMPECVCFKISEIWIEENYEYLSKISDILTKSYILIVLTI